MSAIDISAHTHGHDFLGRHHRRNERQGKLLGVRILSEDEWMAMLAAVGV